MLNFNSRALQVSVGGVTADDVYIVGATSADNFVSNQDGIFGVGRTSASYTRQILDG